MSLSTETQKEGKRRGAPYVAVYTTDRSREKIEERIASFSGKVRRVHIDGPPYFWVVEKIVTTLPSLKVLRITRTMKRLFGTRHMALLESKGVRLKFGYHRPELAWRDDEIRNKKRFDKKAEWFRNLPPAQKGLFQELLALDDADDARVASRYFCLKGESYIPTYEVGRRFGYSSSCASSLVSFKISSVCKLLNDTLEMSSDCKLLGDALETPSGVCAHVRALWQKIEAARDTRRKREEEWILFKVFGVESLPDGIPPSEIATYCVLCELFWEGELHGRLARFVRGLKTLKLRYGLPRGPFRTYESVGQEFGRSGESVRRAEARAFKLLGIRVCRL